MAIAVALTGVGEVSPGHGDAIHSLETLIFESASMALEGAALSRGELDGVVISASDQVDGRAISSMLTSGPAGAYLNEEINVASSPGHALALAYLQILSGTHERLLVSSWGKSSEILHADTQPAERLSTEPFFERDAGLTLLAARGLQACVHRLSSADPAAADAAAARIAAKNHLGSVSEEDVRSSALTAAPLRRLECPPEVDGAFSLVVERRGRSHQGDVDLMGVGWSSDSGRISDRDLIGLPHLHRAVRDAFARSGVANPASDVQVWELHDYSPDAEILAYPALGLCAREDAVAMALAGETRSEGAFPVNPAGGSVRGEAPFGGPLRKVLNALRHVRGDGWGRSDLQVDRAVAQLSSGFAGQFQTVFVLGRSS
jgi:acetyl-CoA C-acetyltransferase